MHAPTCVDGSLLRLAASDAVKMKKSSQERTPSERFESDAAEAGMAHARGVV